MKYLSFIDTSSFTYFILFVWITHKAEKTPSFNTLQIGFVDNVVSLIKVCILLFIKITERIDVDR